jgi:tetratricopeptide (TPR) repeat protein
MAMTRQQEAAERFNTGATADHNDAFRMLASILRDDPDNLSARYALGLLHYDRAVSPFDYPYRKGDRENRGKERDRAIEEFRILLKEDPRPLYAHRYLAVLLAARGQPDDRQEARPHFEHFLNSARAIRQKLVDHTVMSEEPAHAEEAKRLKAAKLQELDQHILEMDDALRNMDPSPASHEPSRDR